MYLHFLPQTYHTIAYHTVPYRTIHKHYTYTHVCCFSLGQVPPPGLGGYRCPCPRAGHQGQWTGGQLRRRQKQGGHLRRGSFLYFFGFPASPLLHLFAFPCFSLLLCFSASFLLCFCAFLLLCFPTFPGFFLLLQTKQAVRNIIRINPKPTLQA